MQNIKWGFFVATNESVVLYELPIDLNKFNELMTLNTPYTDPCGIAF